MSLIHISYLIWVNRIDIGFFIPLTFQKKKKRSIYRGSNTCFSQSTSIAFE